MHDIDRTLAEYETADYESEPFELTNGSQGEAFGEGKGRKEDGRDVLIILHFQVDEPTATDRVARVQEHCCRPEASRRDRRGLEVYGRDAGRPAPPVRTLG